MKYIQQNYQIKAKHVRESLTFVCLSDLHIRESTSKRRLEGLLPKIRKIKQVEAIFITGDLMDSAEQALRPAVAKRAVIFLTNLAKIAPVFLVYGNHDVQDFLPKHSSCRNYRIPTTFRRQVVKIPGVTVLSNSISQTKKFFVAGLELDDKYYDIRPERHHIVENRILLESQLKSFCKQNCQKLPDLPRIFLIHSPVHGDVLKSELKDFDLILAGHMHNGCLPRPFLKLPGTRGFIAPSKDLFPKYARGRDGKLVTLSSVTTLPKTLHLFNRVFPSYFTIVRMQSC